VFDARPGTQPPRGTIAVEPDLVAAICADRVDSRCNAAAPSYEDKLASEVVREAPEE
jgi:hypothetical protein